MEFSITTSVPETTILYENDEVIFTINYRSLLDNPADFQIITTWDNSIFDYVIESATDTETNESPTIDLQEPQITWEINNLAPSSTLAEVSFTLKVVDNLAYDIIQESTISAIPKLIKTSFDPKTRSYTVQGPVAPTATPTGTENPSPTPTPTQTPSPTPTPGQTNPPQATQAGGQAPTPTLTPKFESIKITEINNNLIKLIVKTNIETKLDLFYGINKNKLIKNINFSNYQKTHTIEISELIPNTRYYFKITAENQTGQKTISDAFTFLTAAKKTSFINKKNLIIFAGNILIANYQTNKVILLPKKPITINMIIDYPQQIKQITAKFENIKILGINTYQPPIPVKQTILKQTSPGVFSNQLASPKIPGQYKLIFEIKDKYNGFYKLEAPYSIFVSKPLKIINKNNKIIENALVDFMINKNTIFSEYTNERGEINKILPVNNYLLKIRAINYKTKAYSLNLTESNNLPAIALIPDKSLKNTILYYKSAIKDLNNFITANIQQILTSTRGQKVLILFGVCLIIILIIIYLVLHLLWEASRQRR